MNSCASGVSGRPDALSAEKRASGVLEDEASEIWMSYIAAKI